MANGIFDINQTDAQLQAILDKIQPLVTTGSTAPLGFGYGECTTAGATAAKTVSLTNTVITPGGIIAVNFVNAFTASSPTLAVNGGAAKRAFRFYRKCSSLPHVLKLGYRFWHQGKDPASAKRGGGLQDHVPGSNGTV